MPNISTLFKGGHSVTALISNAVSALLLEPIRDLSVDPLKKKRGSLANTYEDPKYIY